MRSISAEMRSITTISETRVWKTQKKDYEGGTSFSRNKEAKFEETIGKPFFEIEFISSDGYVDTPSLIIAE